MSRDTKQASEYIEAAREIIFDQAPTLSTAFKSLRNISAAIQLIDIRLSRQELNPLPETYMLPSKLSFLIHDSKILIKKIDALETNEYPSGEQIRDLIKFMRGYLEKFADGAR